MQATLTEQRQPFTWFYIAPIILVLIFLLGNVFMKSKPAVKQYSSDNLTLPYYIDETIDLNGNVELRILEVVSGHTGKHAGELSATVRCMENNGTKKAFKTRSTIGEPTNTWLCFDGTDWFALITGTFRKEGSDTVARLVTAYKVNKEFFPTIDTFIKYLVEKWGAFEINYSISAGETFYLLPK